MCKYCELTDTVEIGGNISEFSSNTITTVRDGSLIYDCELSRDRNNFDDRINRNEIIFWLSRETDLGETIIIKPLSRIDIKYCPFCGEEL